MNKPYYLNVHSWDEICIYTAKSGQNITNQNPCSHSYSKQLFNNLSYKLGVSCTN